MEITNRLRYPVYVVRATLPGKCPKGRSGNDHVLAAKLEERRDEILIPALDVLDLIRKIVHMSRVRQIALFFQDISCACPADCKDSRQTTLAFKAFPNLRSEFCITK